MPQFCFVPLRFIDRQSTQLPVGAVAVVRATPGTSTEPVDLNVRTGTMDDGERPQKTGDDGFAVADRIFGDLRATGRPASPRHFEFWFNYKTGCCAELNTAADEIIARKGDISAAEIEELSDRFLSAWRRSDGGWDQVSDRLARQLEEMSTIVDEAMDSCTTQGRLLKAGASELNAADSPAPQQVLRAIDQLMLSAKEGQIRQTVVRTKLEATRSKIAVLQQQLELVRSEAQSDPMTSLANRAAFNRALIEAVAHAQREARPLALMLCELDYFTSFIERFGASAGVGAVRAVSLLLRTHMGAGAFVAQCAADALGVIEPGTEVRTAVALADQFRQALMTSDIGQTSTGQGGGRLTASIGVTAWVPGDDAGNLIERAQAGLRIAKKEGRNRVVEMNRQGAVWTAVRVA
jgi:diguanylate cyclase